MLCQKLGKDITLKDKECDHHIVKYYQICSLNKRTIKELYLILVDANTVKPTAKDCFKNVFKTSQFNREKKKI